MREARSRGRLVKTGETGRAGPGFAMLSVPTLWTVFVINFLALGLIWAYVCASYPSLEAARFWTGSAFAAAAGASMVFSAAENCAAAQVCAGLPGSAAPIAVCAM